MTQVHEGGCVCGAVRYRVTARPLVSQACHCRFCQRRVGSAFATLAYFDEASVELVQGRLSEYEHHSDESGRWLRTQFCPRCGTTLFISVELRPGLKGVATGTFDDPDRVPVERHIWVRSKRPWVVIPAGMPTFPQGSVGAPARLATTPDKNNLAGDDSR